MLKTPASKTGRVRRHKFEIPFLFSVSDNPSVFHSSAQAPLARTDNWCNHLKNGGFDSHVDNTPRSHSDHNKSIENVSWESWQKSRSTGRRKLQWREAISSCWWMKVKLCDEAFKMSFLACYKDWPSHHKYSSLMSFWIHCVESAVSLLSFAHLHTSSQRASQQPIRSEEVSTEVRLAIHWKV